MCLKPYEQHPNFPYTGARGGGTDSHTDSLHAQWPRNHCRWLGLPRPPSKRGWPGCRAPRRTLVCAPADPGVCPLCGSPRVAAGAAVEGVADPKTV